MKTIEEMIAVMQAFKEGKKIECNSDSRINVWLETNNPKWDWSMLDYRVKEEPEYVPYDSVLEIEKDEWVKGKDSQNILSKITMIKLNENWVFVDGRGWRTLEELFKKFEYEDGTPCGKLKGAEE